MEQRIENSIGRLYLPAQRTKSTVAPTLITIGSMDYSALVQQQLRTLHPHLPMPPTAALQLSQQLTAQLQQLIQTQGPLPFFDFMQHLLYAPGLGYYSAGLAKLGAEGDFVTAPELSPLFSQTLAKACQTVLASPQQSVLELGAGRGTMAATMLRFWQQQGCLPEHYFILEVSADLRAVQQQTIAQLDADVQSRVQWLAQWPSHFDGVVIANEVLDAMPHRLFVIREQQLRERAVTLDVNGQFVWTEITANSTLQQWFDALPDDTRQALCEGCHSEVLTLLPAWLDALFNATDRAHVLLIDYGFPRHELYLPERNEGSLMCHYRHTAHDNPLCLIGMQDVTCHVDFTAVAEQAFARGFEIAGYTSQAAFLQDAGILSLAQSDDVATQFGYAQQLKRLLLPSEMGELFKVIYLRKNSEQSLLGFSAHDRRHQL